MNYNNNIPPQHSTPMAPSDREGRFTENAWVYPPGQQAIQGNSASPHSPASGPAQNDTDSYILNAPKYISSTPVTGMSGSAAPRDVGPPSTLVATTPYQIGTGHGDLCSIPYGPSSSAQSDLGLESPLALPAHRHQPSSEWNPLLNVSTGEIQPYLENTRRFPMQPHHAQPSDNMTYDPQRPALVYPPHQEYPDQGARPSAEAAPRARPSPGSAPDGLCGTERQLIQHNHSGPNHQPTKDSFNLAPANHQQPRPRPTIDGSGDPITQPPAKVCTFCGTRFSGNHRQRNWTRHQEKHLGGHIPCGDCASTFRRSDALLKHQRAKHPERGIAKAVPRPKGQAAIDPSRSVQGKAATISPTNDAATADDWNILSGDVVTDRNWISANGADFQDLSNNIPVGYVPRF